MRSLRKRYAGFKKVRHRWLWRLWLISAVEMRALISICYHTEKVILGLQWDPVLWSFDQINQVIISVFVIVFAFVFVFAFPRALTSSSFPLKTVFLCPYQRHLSIWQVFSTSFLELHKHFQCHPLKIWERLISIFNIITS